MRTYMSLVHISGGGWEEPGMWKGELDRADLDGGYSVWRCFRGPEGDTSSLSHQPLFCSPSNRRTKNHKERE